MHDCVGSKKKEEGVGYPRGFLYVGEREAMNEMSERLSDCAALKEVEQTREGHMLLTIAGLNMIGQAMIGMLSVISVYIGGPCHPQLAYSRFR
jgi:hypothetical protein